MKQVRIVIRRMAALASSIHLTTSVIVLPILFWPAAASASPTQPVLPLVRQGDWVLSADEMSCNIDAKFTNGTDQGALRLSKSSLKTGLDLAVGMSSLELMGGWFPYQYRFNTSERMLNAVGQTADLAGLPGFVGVALPNPAAIATPTGRVGNSASKVLSARWAAFDTDSLDRLTFELPRKERLEFELGSMRKPFAMLDACVANLAKSWGFDVSSITGLSRWPLPSSDPLRLLWQTNAAFLPPGNGSRYAYLINVAASGNPTLCRFIGNPLAVVRTDNGCEKIMRKTTFHPALDASGKAVDAYYITKIQVQTDSN